MSKDQAILGSLDASALKGVRPEKAQAALGQVPRLFDELGALERELARATEDAEATLRAAARHLVGSGGKRIRPMVALLSCGACGGEMSAAVPLAAAAELTHSATLLHDDVIDDGQVRRGQPASRVIESSGPPQLIPILAASSNERPFDFSSSRNERSIPSNRRCRDRRTRP